MSKPLSQLPAPLFPGPGPLPAAVVISGMGLSDKDQLFIEIWRLTGDAMAAAVRAKMSDPALAINDLARKTLERPEIIRAIEVLDEAERRAAEEAAAANAAPKPRMPPVEVTKDVVMANLQRAVERGFELDALGAVISASKTQSSILGILKQQVDVTFGFKRAEDMSDEELDRIIKAGSKRMLDGEYKDVTPEGDEHG